MSYILDALKKSDKQRQKDKIPDLQTIQEIEPSDGSPKRSIWPYLLIAVLLVNTVVFVMWWSPWQSEKITVAQNMAPATPPSALSETAPQSKPQPPSAQTTPSEAKGGSPPTIRSTAGMPPANLDTVAKFRPETSAQTMSDAQAVDVPSPQPKTNVVTPAPRRQALEALPVEQQSETNGEEVASPNETLDQNKNLTDGQDTPEQTLASPDFQETESGQQVAPPATEFEPPGEAAGLPPSTRLQPAIASDGKARSQVIDLIQLPTSIRKELPEIHIAAHVYSQKPASRLVSINGRVLREGHTLQPGLKLEEITADGVIFSYEGYNFYVGVF